MLSPLIHRYIGAQVEDWQHYSTQEIMNEVCFRFSEPVFTMFFTTLVPLVRGYHRRAMYKEYGPFYDGQMQLCSWV